jgi:hypothetical protein
MSFLDPFGIFGDHSGKNPADGARSYLDQIPGMEKGYFDPYISRGNAAYDSMNPILEAMMKDPSAFLENIMKDYKTSKGFQLKNDQMLKAAGNSAAAGGMRGSINDIGNEARITDMLMGDDMQQWLKNVLGIQGEGLQGEGHFYDMGYDASKFLAGDLSNILGTEAGLEFQSQREKNQRASDRRAGIGSLIGGGIGAMFGGPAGAYAGSNIGGKFF